MKPETRRIAQRALAMSGTRLEHATSRQAAHLVQLRQLAEAQGLKADGHDAPEALLQAGSDPGRVRSRRILVGVTCLGVVALASLGVLVHVAFFRSDDVGSGTQKNVATEIARGKRLQRVILSFFGFAFSIFCLVFFCLVMGFGDVKQACAEFGLPVRIAKEKEKEKSS